MIPDFVWLVLFLVVLPLTVGVIEMRHKSRERKTWDRMAAGCAKVAREEVRRG